MSEGPSLVLTCRVIRLTDTYSDRSVTFLNKLFFPPTNSNCDTVHFHLGIQFKLSIRARLFLPFFDVFCFLLLTDESLTPCRAPSDMMPGGRNFQFQMNREQWKPGLSHPRMREDSNLTSTNNRGDTAIFMDRSSTPFSRSIFCCCHLSSRKH